MKDSDFFASRFPRISGDNYQTTDTRTVDGLLHFMKPYGFGGRIVDPCADQGSGITNYLKELGYDAHNHGDAFARFPSDWITTNPPFTRKKVDQIIYAQLTRLMRDETKGVAILVRSIFDFAKTREPMFTSSLYSGKIHLCFRVWWSDERDQEPKHNYVWHIWKPGLKLPPCYYYPPYDPRYAVERKSKQHEVA